MIRCQSVVISAMLVLASCAHQGTRDSASPAADLAPASAATQPAVVRLIADAAAASNEPKMVLRIRELKCDAPPATSQPAVPMHAASDAKLVRTFDVVVPIGPNFAATTQIGKTTVRVTGSIDHRGAANNPYYATIDYSESTPFGQPGPAQPVSIRSFRGRYDLASGKQAAVGGLLADPGWSFFDVALVSEQ